MRAAILCTLAGAVFACASTISAQPRRVTPWDVYLSCRGVQAIASSAADSARFSDFARMREFCNLRLPRIGARLTQTELAHWKDALAKLPSPTIQDTARLRGERWLLDRADLLGQLSIGGLPLEFREKVVELSVQQREAVRRIAADFKERLRTNPGELLTVTGYADNNRGGTAVNRSFALQRAQSVVRELVANNIDSSSIHIATDVVPVPRGRTAVPAARAAALNVPSSAGSLAPPEARQARAGGVDVSTILVGTTDFLLAEAREQVEQYLLRRGAAQLCARPQWKDALPVTCELVPTDSVGAAALSVEAAERVVQDTRDIVRQAEARLRLAPQAQPGAAGTDPANQRESAQKALDSANVRLQEAAAALRRTRSQLRSARLAADRGRETGGYLRYFPGVEMLRNAISEDLRTLPYRVSAQALGRVAQGNGALEVRERAVVALYLLRYVEEIGRAETPLTAVQVAAQTLQEDPLKSMIPQGASIVAHLRRASELSSLVTSARVDLMRYWDADALADSASLYTVKAFVLNLPGSQLARDFPSYADSVHTHVDELLTFASNVQGLVVSIERRWEELRAIPRDTTAQRAARAAIVARIADEVIDVAVALLPQDSAHMRRVLQPVPAVRDLTLALADRNAPQVLNSLIQLGRTIDARSMLSTDQMRVLAFGTDIVQAQTTTQVQGAFERFVSAGPGYQGKRGSAERFWRVNAYAGLAGGVERLVDADTVDEKTGLVGSLTLPIGVEVGWPAARNGSWSLFFQAVDLGAIASARINRGDDLEAFPKFSFGSIVAPGVFYVRSFGDSPFVFMAGGTYVPQARQTGDGEWGGLRATAGVAVDIPLFP